MSKVGNFFKGLTWGGRIGIAVVLMGIGYGGFLLYQRLNPKPLKNSSVTEVADFPPLSYDKNANAPFHALPTFGSPSTKVSGPEIRCGIMGWNAQSGILYATGGVQTTQGSLMEEQGLNVKLMCQNNCNKQSEGIYAFIQDYAKGNKNSSKGYQMIAWMGDGVPSYIAGLNEQIKKNIGEDYIVQVFMAGGSSFGEDKFMGQPEWRRDPQKARGSLVTGVLRDGDWNIAMKWASDNNIDVNNDPTTFDPNAINWLAVDDYLVAGELYISGQKETRPIVNTVNGKAKRTGKDTTISITGVVTWTPGDANVVLKKGGLVTIASTKDYSAQMPNTWLASKKWLEDNRDVVEKFVLASMLGGDQVKSHTTALEYSTKVAADLYKDLSAQEWFDYFKGKQVTDAQGNMVEIGGSRVWNLADNVAYFGIDGGNDKYRVIYETFGDLCVKTYPEVVPSYPKYDEVVNLSFINAVYTKNKNNTNMTNASTPDFQENSQMTQLVSSKSMTIEFDFGSSNIRSSSIPALQQLAKDMIIAENLLVTIEGHTDDVGNDDSNLKLSQDRADAIKRWLENYDQQAFKNKITSIGYGEQNPVSSNNTEEGRQKNRRVEIKMGRN